jgi:hypothetical protein
MIFIFFQIQKNGVIVGDISIVAGLQIPTDPFQQIPVLFSASIPFFFLIL